MENEHSVVEGFLLLPPSGKVLKKSWQKKYCILYNKSSTGVARIEIFDSNNSQSHAKIITLEDVIKITKKSANIINVVTKNSTFEFETQSEEFNQWFESLKLVAFSSETNDDTSVEQENDLYCSSDEGVFVVKLHPTEASERCKLLTQNYILVVANSSLQLKDEARRLLVTWPFSFIRKYGYKQGKFIFEAGRKCTTGEGVFHFEHTNYNEIYKCLAAKMKNMKKLLNRGDSSPSVIDCKDFQIQAALNMEPGSRNPLPSSFQTFQEPLIQLPSHFSSVRSFVESFTKEVPKKPPRKYLPPKSCGQAPLRLLPQPYADVNTATNEFGKYDQVESRTNAWKTLGVEEPTHSESLKQDYPDELYTAWSTNEGNQQEFNMILGSQHFGLSNALTNSSSYLTAKSMENIHSTTEPEEYFNAQDMITHIGANEPLSPIVPCSPPATEAYYDHLDHFGKPSAPTNSSSDYKQVPSPMPVHKLKNVNSLTNFYEEVSFGINPPTGYGKIKKDPSSDRMKMGDTERNDGNRDESQRVPYQLHNNQPYAIVSKPKRV